jgi:hypothetical protein
MSTAALREAAGMDEGVVPERCAFAIVAGAQPGRRRNRELAPCTCSFVRAQKCGVDSGSKREQIQFGLTTQQFSDVLSGANGCPAIHEFNLCAGALDALAFEVVREIVVEE